MSSLAPGAPLMRAVAPLLQAQGLIAAGHFEQARRLLARADGADPAVQNLLAIVAVLEGQAGVALVHAQRAVRVAPGDARLHFTLGRAHKLAGDLGGAQSAYRRAIELDPRFAEAHVSLGIALKHAGDLDAAIGCYRQALVLNPRLAVAQANLAYAEAARHERDAAAGGNAPEDTESTLDVTAQALAIDPRNDALQFNHGLLLLRCGRREAAIDAFNRALGLQPGHVGYCLRLGQELGNLGAVAAARTLYERWLERNPPCPPVMRALANLLTRDGEAALGLAWAERAAALDPDPKAWLQLCHAYQQLRRLADSLAAGRRAIAASGGHWELHSIPLMVAQYLLDEPLEIAQMHRSFGQALTASVPAEPRLSPRPLAAGSRLRVGYLSADFLHHSVAYFAAPLLEHHDRERFEIFCYYNRGWGDSMTAQLKALGHAWLDCEGWSDEALARRIRADGIDVLVDLGGHTAGARPRLFALAPAALQVSYLGYPSATGIAQIDRRLTDASIDPGDMPGTGSERPLVLPRSMFCYRPFDTPPIGPVPSVRHGQVTFGSFNNLAKLTDGCLDLWAQVLRAVPGSRLVLKAAAAADAGNRSALERFMAERGVAASRLDLRPRVADRRAHLLQYDDIDVALDPVPYNGATTTCEALWMGVPVVSLRGRTHAGRMGASILRAAGQAGWLADSPATFVDLAAALARDVTTRAAWRASARDRLRASELFDERGHARAVEAALVAAWREAGGVIGTD